MQELCGQAMAAFLEQADAGADSTAMLMLGTHLGASTRMSVLSRPQTADELTAWFAKLWSDRDARQVTARSTVISAFDFWRDRGRLELDVVATLRGQPRAIDPP